MKEYSVCYTIEITIVDSDLFSLRFEFDLKVDIHNIYRRNIKGEGTQDTINFSTTQ